MSNSCCRLPRGAAVTTFAVCAALTASGSIGADPLNPAAHDYDAEYRSEFDKPVLPLDAALPWRERFTADGAFDPRFALGSTPQPTQTPNSPAPDEGPGTAQSTLDARGIVRDIRADAGKLKIEHGPIDRLGMPAMTMMFNLGDPAMIEGLAPGEEIEFNVDMDASGFTITEIRRSGGSR